MIRTHHDENKAKRHDNTHIYIELKISIEEKKKKMPTMLLDNKHLKCI